MRLGNRAAISDMGRNAPRTVCITRTQTRGRGVRQETALVVGRAVRAGVRCWHKLVQHSFPWQNGPRMHVMLENACATALGSTGTAAAAAACLPYHTDIRPMCVQMCMLCQCCEGPCGCGVGHAAADARSLSQQWLHCIQHYNCCSMHVQTHCLPDTIATIPYMSVLHMRNLRYQNRCTRGHSNTPALQAPAGNCSPG